MTSSVAVVIATYNRPKLVLRAIESAWRQVDQVIVVNDGSSELYDENEIKKSRPNVSYIALAKNSGVQVARNTGLGAARTDLAIILDDDDELDLDSVANALQAIGGLEGGEHYPVYNFSCSNGALKSKFCVVRHGDYLTGQISGDFTPIFNLSHPAIPRYPEIDLRVGLEHLLWWPLAQRYGIPSWRDINLVTVSPDAAVRMTSPGTFAHRAADFAIMQKITLDLMKNSGWDMDYPRSYEKRAKALLLYALAGGDIELSKFAAGELSPPKRQFAVAATLLPPFMFRHALYWLKRITLRNSHRP